MNQHFHFRSDEGAFFYPCDREVKMGGRLYLRLARRKYPKDFRVFRIIESHGASKNNLH